MTFRAFVIGADGEEAEVGEDFTLSLEDGLDRVAIHVFDQRGPPASNVSVTVSKTEEGGSTFVFQGTVQDFVNFLLETQRDMRLVTPAKGVSA